MINLPYIKHMSWIAQKHGSAWQMGRNDCMTCLFEYCDKLYNTDRLKTIFEKYNSKTSAIKFWRDMRTTPAQQMHLLGFEKTDTPKEMDIAIAETVYPTAYFRHNDYWHGIEENGYFGAFQQIPGTHTIWRYRNGR